MLSFQTIESHPKFGFVHYLYVGEPDQHETNQNENNHLERTALSFHKLNRWSQEINNQFISNNQPAPPRIPPHLLNILLNQKLPINVCLFRIR
jgi:hypothetical protein